MHGQRHFCPSGVWMIIGPEQTYAYQVVARISGLFLTVVTTDPTPQSIAWSYTAPSGAGNNPQVTFSPANQAQTTTNGHWFALPNRECPNVTADAQYTIITTATFTGNVVRTAQTTLTIDAVWTPAGQVDPNQARVTGVPAMGQDIAGVWRITGMGTLARQIPTKVVFVPTSSQFYNKANQHEQEHLNHWQTGHPLFGSVHQPADFYNQIQNFTDSTQQGLLNQVIAQFQIYTAQQDMIVNQGLNQSEVLAFQVSDPITPKYVYQNCGRYQ